MKHLTPYVEETEFSFWTTDYEGYGRSPDGLRLFCSQPCATRVAVACWNAGMRIKRDK
jgi:hypothetical protein